MGNSNLTLMKMKDMQTPVVRNKTMSPPISILNKISMENQKTLQSTNKRIKTTIPIKICLLAGNGFGDKGKEVEALSSSISGCSGDVEFCSLSFIIIL